MNRLFSIKSAAMLCVATLVMCFSSHNADAQCRGGGYGGGFGRPAGFNSGFRGVNVNRGFGTGVSIQVGRPAFVSPVYRGGGFYGGGLYGNSFNRGGFYGSSFNRSSFYGGRGIGFGFGF